MEFDAVWHTGHWKSKYSTTSTGASGLPSVVPDYGMSFVISYRPVRPQLNADESNSKNDTGYDSLLKTFVFPRAAAIFTH